MVVLNPVIEIGKINVMLNEFAAENEGELIDDISQAPDWIELYNSGPNPLDLSEWTMSDDSLGQKEWVFPDGIQIEAEGYLILFASDRNLNGVSKPPDRYHTNFKLSRERCEYLALKAPDAMVFTEYRHLPALPKSLSYGLLDGGKMLLQKTPGAANRLPDPDPPLPLSPPVVDKQSGYCSGAFSVSVSLTNPEEEVEIRYTTDGSDPMEESAILITPLLVSASQILKVRAFAPGRQPSGIVTRSFLFPVDIVQQDSLNPSIGGDSGAVRDSLWALSAMVIADDPSAIFDEAGLLDAAVERGARKATVEFFPTDGGAEPVRFSTTAGVRLHGRRSIEESPKLSFRLQWRSEFGEGKLNAPVFGGMASQSFDNLVLRGGFNNSWTHPDADQRQRAQGIRDAFARESHQAMGQKSAHSRFVHLFLNTRYWGIYELTELPDDSFAAHGACFDDRDYDVIDAGEEADGGERAKASWAELVALVAGSASPLPNMNSESLADFFVLHTFLGTQEMDLFSANGAVQNNWFAWQVSGARPGYEFVVWDSERGLESAAANYLTLPNRSLLLDSFASDPEARLLLADRIHKHTKAGGVLSEAASVARYTDLADTYGAGIAAELARWGDKVEPQQPGSFAQWDAERVRVLTTILTERSEVTVAQFHAAGLYPDTLPPSFGLAPGYHGIGIPLTFSNVPSGAQVFFTLDGSDPRLPGGSLSTSAILAAFPFYLAGEQTVTARVLHNGEWGPVDMEYFVFGFANIEPGALRITEIMPDPVGGNDDLSFIEFYNAGEKPIALAGLTLSGDVEFSFAQTLIPILEPGKYLLLVENRVAFEQFYGSGLPVAGEYDKSLNNTLGKDIIITSISGDILFNFEPERYLPWPRPGIGFSVVLVDGETADPAPDPHARASWRQSSQATGSPGRADPPVDERFTGVEFSEVKASSIRAANAFELRNTRNVPVDISAWQVRDAASIDPFPIPAGTVIPANGGLAFYADDDDDLSNGVPGPDYFGSLLDLNLSTSLLLSPFDENGFPVGAFSSVYYSKMPEDATRSAYTDSTGRGYLPVTNDTLGASINAPPRVETLIIHEVQQEYLRGMTPFVELRNRSGAPLRIADAAHKLDSCLVSQLFGDAVMPPQGLALVVAGDAEEFRAQYGVAADIPIAKCGEFVKDLLIFQTRTGSDSFLSNEYLYLNDNDFPESFIDGDRSLVRSDLTGFAPDPASWRASCVRGGTPGRLPVLSLEDVVSGLPAEFRSAEADPDGDGLNNLIEFAFASEPAVAGSAPVSTTVADDNFSITFRRPHETFDEIWYLLEKTNKGISVWVEIEPDLIEEAPQADGTLEVKWSVSVGAGEAGFFRVRVEMQAP